MEISKQISQEIIQNLLGAIPVIHRKLTAVLDDGVGQGLTHYHFAILGMLSRTESLTASEIGRRLIVSKPQMTAIIDKLVDSGLVARQPDSKDRRIINIYLTEQGKEVLDKAVRLVQKNFEKKFTQLSREDLDLLCQSLRNIRNIGVKIE